MADLVEARILAERADRLATTSARIASTFPSRGLAAHKRGQTSLPGRLEPRQHPAGQAFRTARGPAGRAVHLDHLHPRRPQEPGQASAVGAGALHPDPGHWPEPRTARTARQPGRPDSQDGLLATERLLRPYFGMHRFDWPDDDAVEFHLGHGDMIRLLRRWHLEVEDRIELQPPPGATTRHPLATLERARNGLPRSLEGVQTTLKSAPFRHNCDDDAT